MIQATVKAFGGNDDAIDHLAEEIADVEICMEQVKYLLELDKAVEDYKDYKVQRQLNRILEETLDMKNGGEWIKQWIKQQ